MNGEKEGGWPVCYTDDDSAVQNVLLPAQTGWLMCVKCHKIISSEQPENIFDSLPVPTDTWKMGGKRKGNVSLSAVVILR